MSDNMYKIRKAEAQKEAAALREELDSNAAAAENPDTDTDSEDEDIDRIVIIHESGDDKPYKLMHSEVSFDVDITEDGELILTKGKLVTNYLIRNTDVDKIETWRYVITGVKLLGFHVDAAKDTITYEFSADDFMDQTLVDDDG